MTTISSLQSLMNGASTTSATSSATSTDAMAEAEDRFMKLLITQMQNQDPLNPLDNAEITSQLAQLSTVTGINKLNTTLEALQSSMALSQSYQAADMIGHGVFVSGSDVSLASSKGILGASLESGADAVVVTIRDATGKLVRTINAGAQKAGVMALAWDGKTDNGATAADGNYKFDVLATSAPEKVKATSLSFGEVLSVTAGSAGVKLNLSNASVVGMSDIYQIY